MAGQERDAGGIRGLQRRGRIRPVERQQRIGVILGEVGVETAPGAEDGIDMLVGELGATQLGRRIADDLAVDPDLEIASHGTELHGLLREYAKMAGGHKASSL